MVKGFQLAPALFFGAWQQEKCDPNKHHLQSKSVKVEHEIAHHSRPGSFATNAVHMDGFDLGPSVKVVVHVRYTCMAMAD